MDFADDFVVDDLSHFVIFLKGNFLQISSCLEVILGYFCFTEFSVLELYLFFLPISACLNYLEIISPRSVCLNSSGIVRILFPCEYAWIGFTVQVFFYLDQICRACFQV